MCRINRRKGLGLTVFSILFVFFSCGQDVQPVLENPVINPAKLNPEEVKEVLLSVEANDPKGAIYVIQVTSPDIPDASFTLNDKGINGDKTADDNTWSLLIPLPPPDQIPRGKINAYFGALRKDYSPVIIKNPEGVKEPLMVKSVLEVEYPKMH